MTSSLILIIEDALSIAEIYAEIFTDLGYETEILTDGAKAVERLAAVQPKMIILDMHLPSVSGPELLQRIHADARLASTKLVVITADALRAQALEAEADLVLVKPVSYDQMSELVARLL